MYIIVILFKDDLEAFVGTSESVSSLEVRIRLYFISFLCILPWQLIIINFVGLSCARSEAEFDIFKAFVIVFISTATAKGKKIFFKTDIQVRACYSD